MLASVVKANACVPDCSIASQTGSGAWLTGLVLMAAGSVGACSGEAATVLLDGVAGFASGADAMA